MEELNKRKRKYDKLRSTGIIVGIIGALVMLVFGSSLNLTEDGLWIVFLGAVPGGIIYIVANAEVKKISIEFKNTFVKAEIEKRITDSYFNPNEGVSSTIVGDSKLAILHERYSTEDLLKGKVNEVDFMCADVHIQDVRRSGKHTTVVTTFKGRFYQFDFPKEFNSNVLLLQPGQYRPFSGLQKVKLESIDFNSEFKIYTTNEHDTFYLLTPQLMDKLLVLDRKYADKIGFSFLYNKLYIAIDSRTDAFDVMHMGDITLEHIDNAVREIENIIEFVEYLRLDNTLFKK